MPELPEVQTVVTLLAQKRISGRRITGASVTWNKSIGAMTPTVFRRTIVGRTIKGIGRRGKYIVVGLSGGWTLLIHLRMSGRLNLLTARTSRNKHEHVVLQLDANDELRFQDTRKFGRFLLTDTPEKVLDRLGMEPLEADFTLEWLKGMLQSRNRQIKPLLLDQRILAGLGNIYVDEALWKAGVHPQRKSQSLCENEIDNLHKAIPHVLRKGLRNMGTALGTGKANFYFPGNRVGRNAEQLNVFRRTGKSCPRCGEKIERIIVAQRSSHVCFHCQPPPF
jgi:formamidopyrimidine-DNA glycosylase